MAGKLARLVGRLADSPGKPRQAPAAWQPGMATCLLCLLAVNLRCASYCWPEWGARNKPKIDRMYSTKEKKKKGRKQRPMSEELDPTRGECGQRFLLHSSSILTLHTRKIQVSCYPAAPPLHFQPALPSSCSLENIPPSSKTPIKFPSTRHPQSFARPLSSPRKPTSIAVCLFCV